MKTPLPLLLCLATLPLRALAQNTPVLTNAPGPSSASSRSNALLHVVPSGAIALRAQEESVETNPFSAITMWTNPKDGPLSEANYPRMTLDGRKVHAEGLLADIFSGPASPEEQSSVGQKILSVIVPQHSSRPAWEGGYLKWGQSEKPWAVASERPRFGPEGILLSVHF